MAIFNSYVELPEGIQDRMLVNISDSAFHRKAEAGLASPLERKLLPEDMKHMFQAWAHQ